MDKSENRFERDIESFLISPEGGYTQFCGQDEEGNWVHNRQRSDDFHLIGACGRCRNCTEQIEKNQGILIWDNLILFYIFFA